MNSVTRCLTVRANLLIIFKAQYRAHTLHSLCARSGNHYRIPPTSIPTDQLLPRPYQDHPVSTDGRRDVHRRGPKLQHLQAQADRDLRLHARDRQPPALRAHHGGAPEDGQDESEEWTAGGALRTDFDLLYAHRNRLIEI